MDVSKVRVEEAPCDAEVKAVSTHLGILGKRWYALDGIEMELSIVQK